MLPYCVQSRSHWGHFIGQQQQILPARLLNLKKNSSLSVYLPDLRATCWKNTVIFSFLYVRKKVKFESCVSLEISRVYMYSCLRKSISKINLMLWIFKSLYFKLNSFLCAQSLEEKPIYLVRHLTSKLNYGSYVFLVFQIWMWNDCSKIGFRPFINYKKWNS